MFSIRFHPELYCPPFFGSSQSRRWPRSNRPGQLALCTTTAVRASTRGLTSSSRADLLDAFGKRNVRKTIENDIILLPPPTPRNTARNLRCAARKVFRARVVFAFRLIVNRFFTATVDSSLSFSASQTGTRRRRRNFRRLCFARHTRVRVRFV